MTRRILLAAVLAALLTAPAAGWEASSTHAGVTEAAALGSGLHAALGTAHGRELGLYEPLTVKRETAAALYEKLALLEPSEGYVPDARGRQPALAWLVAGAVIEDLPALRARHHFLDPVHDTGLTKGRGKGLVARLYAALSRAHVPDGGMPAADWIFSPDNDLGMKRFWKELEASASAETREARDAHLAYALLCAGAMTHVLEDVGSPSRARDDWAEHMSELGAGPSDRGSRFERLAALAYGRLGVAQPTTPVAREKARDYFTAADGKGLADVTAARWYSSGTLPAPLLVAKRPRPGELPERVAKAQRRFPSPRPQGELDLRAAAVAGVALRDAHGVCLANYRFEDETLSWYISDECAAEQLAAILPEVAAYAAGFLEFLFRGSLTVSPRGEVSTGAVALGKGTLRGYAEDASGNRRAVGEAWAIDAAGAEAALAEIEVPDDAVRVIAVFRGVDANGEELVAVGEARIAR